MSNVPRMSPKPYVDVFADGHLRVGRLVFHGRLHSGRQPECTQTLGLVQ